MVHPVIEVCNCRNRNPHLTWLRHSKNEFCAVSFVTFEWLYLPLPNTEGMYFCQCTRDKLSLKPSLVHSGPIMFGGDTALHKRSLSCSLQIRTWNPPWWIINRVPFITTSDRSKEFTFISFPVYLSLKNRQQSPIITAAGSCFSFLLYLIIDQKEKMSAQLVCGRKKKSLDTMAELSKLGINTVMVRYKTSKLQH